ncbi:MAG TPA: glycosyltransferase family 39 protein [Anaerolineaceae bacterium]|nr:glycosyltransferase family 39 protein [Anaerolineaceae bacterium]
MTEQEPTVLDYVKARLTPWRSSVPTISQAEPVAAGQLVERVEPAGEPAKPPSPRVKIPWKVLAALFFALVAQRLLEPAVSAEPLAAILYLIAAGLAVSAMATREWQASPLVEWETRPLPVTLRGAPAGSFWSNLLRSPLLLAMAASLLAFLLFGGNFFNPINLTVWAVALLMTVWSLWIPAEQALNRRERIVNFIRQPALRITITPWSVLVVLAVALVVFFRFYRLAEVPGEMFSDHAEKLLDVADVLRGDTHIFFLRNTGREAFQFYLTAAIASLLGTGLSFISLKFGTALAGLATLPFLYLLGKEIGNRWTGLAAFVLAGIAYWPNVIARVGLRFPLYPLFVAPALYFFVRGMRHRTRNDFIWAGLFLGIGLHGYSPIRLLPLVIVVGVVLYLLHRQSVNNRWPVVWALAALALVSLIVFLPLLRYILEDPNGMFGYRAFSRLAETEREIPAPVWMVFFSNLWNAWIMPFADNGRIWVHSVPNRPALDVVTAALYFLGTVLIIYRYVRQRHWLDLFLLVSVPLLMLPSILSLAFPEENPSLNRTGGAIVPVFVIAAVGLESAISSLRARWADRQGAAAGGILVAVLLLFSVRQNYDLVFRQYDNQFLAGAWNSSEMGQVIKGFAGSVGSYESAYVIPYPYWVDTRLVAINAGSPVNDYAIWPDQLPLTLDETRGKLFIVHPEDDAAVESLWELYPQGMLNRFDARTEGKDFLMFFVPPVSSANFMNTSGE